MHVFSLLSLRLSRYFHLQLLPRIVVEIDRKWRANIHHRRTLRVLAEKCSCAREGAFHFGVTILEVCYLARLNIQSIYEHILRDICVHIDTVEMRNMRKRLFLKKQTRVCVWVCCVYVQTHKYNRFIVVYVNSLAPNVYVCMHTRK